jgi:mono/diheme cytochrome c family protein
MACVEQHSLDAGRIAAMRTAGRWMAILGAVLLACCRAQGGDTVDFARDVRPIFQTRCLSCHGHDKQRGGLRLDGKAALAGGDSGVVIVPGHSDKSPLMRRISSSDAAQRMPPKGEPLTSEQVRVLRDWIEQGANWPDDAADPMKEHWAFNPVVRPVVSEVETNGWARNPIDRFVVAKLRAVGLTPSPEADKPTLLRRLKFDLLGLPPTPDEIDAFVADARPDAYERLVERLLASPHYGERWARHWLDVVRFAESHGFEMNQPRPNAWPYRDYVIRAFNEDKPYDRFIAEQLAGDALGADAATGFLVAGPWDQVKSPDIVLTRMQRADELHDLINTTGSAFLGLTVGCARCHNHKFDPISQADYYGMKAIFAGVQHGERPLPSKDTAQRQQEADRLRRRIATLSGELDALEPLAQPNGPNGRRRPVNARKNIERFPVVEAKYVRFTVLATNNLEPCLDELEVFAAGASPRNVALASAGAKATSSGNYAGAPEIHRLEHINDGRYGNSRSWIANELGKGWVQIELKEPTRIDCIVWGRDREGKFADRLAVRYRIEAALEPGQWQLIASSEDRAAAGSSFPQSPDNKRLSDELTGLERRLTEIERQAKAYLGIFSKPEETHRLHRGDPMQPREPVAPAALSAFGATLPLSMSTPERERRLALAKWITDPGHPLTARVLVNRLWQHHFGDGIVSTPSDFGLNGAKPTHPELLDWLAAEFRENRWSIKHIHQLIVLSATYRQSSAASSAGLAADAGSRLLWRYPPRRLEAEPIRDAILAVSGNLDLGMGGLGFDLFEPNTNYVKVYNPKKEFGPLEWRRMIYQNKPRMQLDDTFGQFDCPDTGQIAPKRGSSTTALQALNLLNSRFLMQQAAIFAERLRREATYDAAAQARIAFRLAFGRGPSQDEQDAAVGLIREHGRPAFCRALFNTNEFLYVY